MRSLLEAIVVPGLLLLLPARVRAGDDVAAGSAPAPAARPGDAAPAPEAMPPSPSGPAEPPTAPPSQLPPAPPTGARPQASQPVPPGQWVYTQQYGWVWMPYGAAYAYAPPGGYGEPYMYVYYPAYGWTWLVAPWVWGFGPWPYFGIHGPWRFAWYGYGWWRTPWRWHVAPAPFGVYGLHGLRPGPYWGGFGHGLGPRGGFGFRRAGPGWGGGRFGRR